MQVQLSQNFKSVTDRFRTVWLLVNYNSVIRQFKFIIWVHLLSRLVYVYPVDILGNLLHTSICVHNLGVLFDAGLSVSKQINGIWKCCYYQMCDFPHIRHFMLKSVAITVSNALVSSRLDYSNSLLKGCHEYNLRRLQGIQNYLCRIVTHTH